MFMQNSSRQLQFYELLCWQKKNIRTENFATVMKTILLSFPWTAIKQTCGSTAAFRDDFGWS